MRVLFFCFLVATSVVSGCDTSVDCRGRIAGGLTSAQGIRVRCGDDVDVCDTRILSTGLPAIDCPKRSVDHKVCRLENFCFIPTETGISPGVRWVGRFPSETALHRTNDVVVEGRDMCCFELVVSFSDTGAVVRDTP